MAEAPLSGRVRAVRAHRSPLRGVALVPPMSAVMQAVLLRVWLRPVSKHEGDGEQSAVVCHCV